MTGQRRVPSGNDGTAPFSAAQEKPKSDDIQEDDRAPLPIKLQHQPIREPITRNSAAAVEDVEINIPLPVPEFQGQISISSDLENTMRNAHTKIPISIQNMTNMTTLDIFLSIKRLASFLTVNRIRGSSLQTLSGILLNELKSADRDGSRSTYGTLWLISGGSQYSDVVTEIDTRADAGLYECLTNYFLLYLFDKNNDIPRHTCSREECSTYCILPIYARRILPDRTVNKIFCKIKEVVQRYPRLISKDDDFETHERDSAANLLKHMALNCEPSDICKEGFDTLYAMSGENQTIFDYNSKVDSRLYELIFDELRQFDYKRTSTQRLQTMPKWSVPFLTKDASTQLQRNIAEYSRIANERIKATAPPPAYSGLANEVLPGYRSLKLRSQADTHNDNNEQPVIITTRVDGIPSVIITPPTPTTEILPPGPVLVNDSDLPSYEEVLAGITENHDGEQSF